MNQIEAEARALRQEKLLGEVSAVLNSVRIHNTWRSSAVLIYRNWLEHLCMQKPREVVKFSVRDGQAAGAEAGVSTTTPNGTAP